MFLLAIYGICTLTVESLSSASHFVLCTGFEPVLLPWKGSDLALSRTEHTDERTLGAFQAESNRIFKVLIFDEHHAHEVTLILTIHQLYWMYNFYFAIHLCRREDSNLWTPKRGDLQSPAIATMRRRLICADGELRYLDLELNRFLLCPWATSACCAYGKTRTSNFTRIRRVLWPLNYISI